MKEYRIMTVVAILAVVAICVIETVALLKGVNGVALATSLSLLSAIVTLTIKSLTDRYRNKEGK